MKSDVIEGRIRWWELWAVSTREDVLLDNLDFLNDLDVRRSLEKKIMEAPQLRTRYLKSLKEADKKVLNNIENLVAIFTRGDGISFRKREWLAPILTPAFWWYFMDEIVNGNIVVDIDNEIVKYKGKTYRL